MLPVSRCDIGTLVRSGTWGYRSAMDQLVSTRWLEAGIEAKDLVVLDCTVRLESTPDGYKSISGRADFEAAHIPGARFADLEGALSDLTSPHRFAVPEPQVFAAAMEALGVGDDSRVVLYDDNQSMWASRVWWMLRWIGFDRAALLDGGMRAWRDEGRPITAEEGDVVRSRLTVNVRSSLIADKSEVMAAIGDGSTCIIDALPEAMFRGEATAYRRPGHIPGATNTAASSLIDTTSGRFLSDAELESKFGSDRSSRTITYCGGGIAASADAFVMTRLGFEDVAVYTASLQEWAADPDTPLTTD